MRKSVAIGALAATLTIVGGAGGGYYHHQAEEADYAYNLAYAADGAATMIEFTRGLQGQGNPKALDEMDRRSAEVLRLRRAMEDAKGHRLPFLGVLAAGLLLAAAAAVLFRGEERRKRLLELAGLGGCLMLLVGLAGATAACAPSTKDLERRAGAGDAKAFEALTTAYVNASSATEKTKVGQAIAATASTHPVALGRAVLRAKDWDGHSVPFDSQDARELFDYLAKATGSRARADALAAVYLGTNALGPGFNDATLHDGADKELAGVADDSAWIAAGVALQVLDRNASASEKVRDEEWKKVVSLVKRLADGNAAAPVDDDKKVLDRILSCVDDGRPCPSTFLVMRIASRYGPEDRIAGVFAKLPLQQGELSWAMTTPTSKMGLVHFLVVDRRKDVAARLVDRPKAEDLTALAGNARQISAFLRSPQTGSADKASRADESLRRDLAPLVMKLEAHGCVAGGKPPKVQDELTALVKTLDEMTDPSKGRGKVLLRSADYVSLWSAFSDLKLELGQLTKALAGATAC